MALDWANALSGGATAAGMAAPSANPWIIGGAGLAGATAGLFGFGKDKPEKLKEFQKYTPQQRQMMSDLIDQVKAGNQQAIDFYQKILSDDPEAFADFERPAMEQFEQQTVPNILERLNRGGGMSKGGSYLNQTLSQAARGLSGDLASMKANLKQNAVQGLQNYSQLGLKEQTTPYIQGGSKGAWSQGAPAAAAGYSKWLENVGESQGVKNFTNRFAGGI